MGETTASHCETAAAVDPAGTGPEAEPRGQAEVDRGGEGMAVAMEVEASEREGSLDPDGVCEREGEEQLAVDPSAAANWKQPDIVSVVRFLDTLNNETPCFFMLI